MAERRFLGVIEVDSATVVVGDPVYLLPDKAQGKPGVEYQTAIEATGSVIGGYQGVVVSGFGGDGAYPVFGEYEDGELLRLVVLFDSIEEDEE